MSLFNQTAIGFGHLKKGIGCEDASLAWSNENGDIQFIAVSDGHGDPNCFRSSIGSKIAVEVALEKFKMFVASLETIESLDDYFEDPRIGPQHLKRLTDAIIDSWLTKVYENYSQNPVSEEEIKAITSSLETLEKDIPHIYGATLIAVLKYRNYFIGVHQGDGRCIAVKEDGTCYQPIPWDEICQANVSTSLCNDSAAIRIRSIALNKETEKIAGIFLMSDGVEDSYLDSFEEIGESHYLMAGVHVFVKTLVVELILNPDFLQELERVLERFSRDGQFETSVGSGDDISVAGIYDLEILNRLIPQFKVDIEVYGIDEKISYFETLLNKKRRNHEYWESKVSSLETEHNYTLEQIQKLESEVTITEEEIGNLQKEIYELNEQTVALNDSQVNFDSRIDELLSTISDWSGLKTSFLNIFDIEKQKLNHKVSKLLKVKKEDEQHLEDLIKKRDGLQERIVSLGEELKKTINTYNRYHQDFVEIEDILDSLKIKKQSLSYSSVSDKPENDPANAERTDNFN